MNHFRRRTNAFSRRGSITPHLLALISFVVAGWHAQASAVPLFARRYAVDCTGCHAAPPRLHQNGENFLARGYRFGPDQLMPAHRTVPAAVWSTYEFEHRQSADFSEAFLSRVEVISGGPIGRSRASYFIEWRPVSKQVAGRNRVLDRSGRFEDLFVNVPLTSGTNLLTVTAGQFRALNQVDVSRRLSLSEPLALSAGVPASKAATKPRLTALRGFSPAGRQPGIRLAYQRPGLQQVADGWTAAITLPLTGEFTIPLKDAASFEFEAVPKGAFLESYYRSGLNSVGAHAFLGDRRHVANLVVVSDLIPKFQMFGAVGVDRSRDVDRMRYSFGGELVFNQHAIVGARLDHRTKLNTEPALLVFFNGHLPFGPPHFRQALRVQFEQRWQANADGNTLALSHIF